jgi:methionyl-tRNA formyltransferase
MRLLFAGTPAVALPSLEALARDHEVAAVLTRPPAARGRSGRPVPSPVHAWALDHGAEVVAPASARDPGLLDRVRELAPDCCPVVAYGGLIPPALLALPRLGWLNLHFSLLPRWRGAAPVQHAILAGDEVTGATVFRLVEALDAGPVFATLSRPVGAATAGELLADLAERGAALLGEAVAAAGRGEEPVPQAADGVTLAPKIRPEDVALDWAEPAERLERLVRAAHPEPGAWTTVAGKRLRVLRAEVADEALAPGEWAVRKREVLVGTATAALRLVEVWPEGKKAMPGADWGRGLRT